MTSIAFISTWSCPLSTVGFGKNGGMSIFIRNLIKKLSQKEIEVDVFTCSHQNTHEVSLIDKNIHLIHLRNSLQTSTEIADYINKKNKKYDFFYSHYYLSGCVGIELKKKFGIPLYHTFHSLSKIKEGFEGRDPQRFTSEKKVFDSADKIIPLSKYETKILEKYYGNAKNKIHIIYPGVNHQQFFPQNKINIRLEVGLPLSPLILLFVGRTEKIKGINFLLSVYKKWNSSTNYDTRLVIVGEGNNLIQEKSEYIKFFGAIPYKILPKFYTAADILIIPSFAETFGLTSLEAMSCGLPVIASRVGGLPEIIRQGKNGYLFTPGDKGELMNSLDRLVKDNNLRISMGKFGEKISKMYTWNKTAEKLISLFNAEN